MYRFFSLSRKQHGKVGRSNPHRTRSKHHETPEKALQSSVLRRRTHGTPPRVRDTDWAPTFVEVLPAAVPPGERAHPVRLSFLNRVVQERIGILVAVRSVQANAVLQQGTTTTRALYEFDSSSVAKRKKHVETRVSNPAFLSGRRSNRWWWRDGTLPGRSRFRRPCSRG